MSLLSENIGNHGKIFGTNGRKRFKEIKNSLLELEGKVILNTEIFEEFTIYTTKLFH
jgi:hypothetical protein